MGSFTLHASRFTLHASRFTLHASRFTLHASRFTLLILILLFSGCGEPAIEGKSSKSSDSATGSHIGPSSPQYGQTVEVALNWSNDDPSQEPLFQDHDSSVLNDSSFIQYGSQRLNPYGRTWHYIRDSNPIAYASNSDNSFQEVAARNRGQLHMAPSYREWTWTFPSTEESKPTLVSFENNHFGELIEKVTVDSPGNTVVVRVEQDASYEYRVYVNGQHVGGYDAATFIDHGRFVTPGFRSPYTGPHTINFDAGTSDQYPYNYTYHQRALVFLDDFPDYDVSSGEPVTITNKVEWSDGTPADDVLWSLSIGGQVKNGTGADISATWKPEERTLARGQGQVQPKMLRPEGLRTREDLEGITYSVLASAPAYPKWYASEPQSRYRVRSNAQVASKRGSLEIINDSVTPEIPFEEPGSSVNMSATVVTIATDLPPSDITWKVHLLDPQGNKVLSDLATGTGPQVQAEWDGTINGQAVEHPSSHQFDIEAELREVPIFASRSMENSIRTQEAEGNFLLTASKKVPIGPMVEIIDITFAGTESLQQDPDIGPYGVFDYINVQPYWVTPGSSEPQWQSEQEKHIPVVMKAGSTMKVGAKCRVTTSNSNLESMIVKATGQLNGESVTIGTSEPIPRSQWGAPIIFDYTLPDTIGRHGLTIDWEFDFGSTGGVGPTAPSLLAHSKTPTDDKKHRLYTVFGPQASETKNDSNVFFGEEIWYHPETFQDEVPVSEASSPPTRSPLDLATHWAGGAEGHLDAVVEISRKLYDEGGYEYNRSTKFSIPSDPGAELYQGLFAFKLYESLKDEPMECTDGAIYVKALANWLGIPAKIRRIELPPGAATERNPDYIFTNYIRLIGQDEGKIVRDQQALWHAPKFHDPEEFGWSFGSPAGMVRNPNDEHDRRQINYNWIQWTFTAHHLVEVADMVIDPTARRDSAIRPPIDLSPDYILNHLNVSIKSYFENGFVSLYGKPLPDGALDFAQENYRDFLQPQPALQSPQTLEQYLNETLYGYSQPQSFKTLNGYNDHDFQNTSILYDKAELRR